MRFESSFISQKCHTICVDKLFLCSKRLIQLVIFSCIILTVSEVHQLNNLKLAQPVLNTLNTLNCYEGRSSQLDE